MVLNDAVRSGGNGSGRAVPGVKWLGNEGSGLARPIRLRLRSFLLGAITTVQRRQVTLPTLAMVETMETSCSGVTAILLPDGDGANRKVDPHLGEEDKQNRAFSPGSSNSRSWSQSRSLWNVLVEVIGTHLEGELYGGYVA